MTTEKEPKEKQPQETFFFYVVKKCTALQSPALFLTLEDCCGVYGEKDAKKESEEEKEEKNYKGFMRMVDAILYLIGNDNPQQEERILEELQLELQAAKNSRQQQQQQQPSSTTKKRSAGQACLDEKEEDTVTPKKGKPQNTPEQQEQQESSSNPLGLAQQQQQQQQQQNSTMYAPILPRPTTTTTTTTDTTTTTTTNSNNTTNKEQQQLHTQDQLPQQDSTTGTTAAPVAPTTTPLFLPPPPPPPIPMMMPPPGAANNVFPGYPFPLYPPLMAMPPPHYHHHPSSSSSPPMMYHHHLAPFMNGTMVPPAYNATTTTTNEQQQQPQAILNTSDKVFQKKYDYLKTFKEKFNTCDISEENLEQLALTHMDNHPNSDDTNNNHTTTNNDTMSKENSNDDKENDDNNNDNGNDNDDDFSFPQLFRYINIFKRQMKLYLKQPDKSTFTKERIQRLKDLGFDFEALVTATTTTTTDETTNTTTPQESDESLFFKKYELLKAFQTRFHTCDVSEENLQKLLGGTPTTKDSDAKEGDTTTTNDPSAVDNDTENENKEGGEKEGGEKEEEDDTADNDNTKQTRSSRRRRRRTTTNGAATSAAHLIQKKFAKLPKYVKVLKKELKSYYKNPEKSTLTEERIQKLKDLGFFLDTIEKEQQLQQQRRASKKTAAAATTATAEGGDSNTHKDDWFQSKKWEGMFESLKEYHKQYGTCDIPTGHHTLKDNAPKYDNLDKFVSENRTQIKLFQIDSKASKLNKDKVKRLMDIGFVMKPERRLLEKRALKIKSTWDAMIQELYDFKCKHGKFEGILFSETLHDNKTLRAWVKDVREEFQLLKQNKPSILTSENIQQLSELGLNLSVTTQKNFDERALEWFEFKTKHGRDPKKMEPNEEYIAAWVLKTRTKYAKHLEGEKTNLTQERIDKLTRWGFRWGISKQKKPEIRKSWNERFEEILKYKEVNNNCLVPQSYEGLGGWVKQQRKEYQNYRKRKKSALSEEKLQKLQSIGFVFEVQKTCGRRRRKVPSAEESQDTSKSSPVRAQDTETSPSSPFSPQTAGMTPAAAAAAANTSTSTTTTTTRINNDPNSGGIGGDDDELDDSSMGSDTDSEADVASSSQEHGNNELHHENFAERVPAYNNQLHRQQQHRHQQQANVTAMMEPITNTAAFLGHPVQHLQQQHQQHDNRHPSATDTTITAATLTQQFPNWDRNGIQFWNS